MVSFVPTLMTVLSVLVLGAALGLSVSGSFMDGISSSLPLECFTARFGVEAFIIPSSPRGRLLRGCNSFGHGGCHSRRTVSFRNIVLVSGGIGAKSSEGGDTARTSLASSLKDDDNRVNGLRSAYDVTLPASLRGEAVRSALRSDRGTCLDFTSPADSNSSSTRNVGVVKVVGKTAKDTINFLNSKLTNSFHLDDSTSSLLDIINLDNSNNNIDDVTCKVEMGRVKEACLLTSKGRTIDKLLVTLFHDTSTNRAEANLITSPGHAGSTLFQRLDPFIFPLDGIRLFDLCPSPSSSSQSSSSSSSRVFTIASTQLETAQSVMQQFVFSQLSPAIQSSLKHTFPSHLSPEQCLRYTSELDNLQLTVLEHTFLPTCMARGYTLVLTEQSSQSNSNANANANIHFVADQIWNRLTNPTDYSAPVELGPLEYESLRIEAGQPGYGTEMTGDTNPHSPNNSDSDKKSNPGASPLELNLQNTIDETKGCYQGQERIAALLQNASKSRAPPRTLYQILFSSEDNFYDGYEFDEEEYSNHDSPRRIQNRTPEPQVGDELYVLGSNESIKVGSITSVSEVGGTSISGEICALALVKRSKGILEKMTRLGLDLEFGLRDGMDGDGGWDGGGVNDGGGDGWGMIQPPSLDPLDGLEVVVGGSFTRGILRAVPERRLKKGDNLLEVELWSPFQEGGGVGSADGASGYYEANAGREDGGGGAGSIMGFIPQSGDGGGVVSGGGVGVGGASSIVEELDSKKFVNGVDEVNNNDDDDDDDDDDEISLVLGEDDDDDNDENEDNEDLERAIQEAAKAAKEAEAAAAEAKRKAEKMELLQKRAQAAMEARKQKAQEQKMQQEKEKEGDAVGDKSKAEAEKQRKAEKMELLRKRAEAAMEARRKKNAQN